jgi:hypothetical protein
VSAIHSHLRVQALAEVSKRYGGTIRQLVASVEEVLPEIEGEPRVRLERALGDADAQIAAAGEALDRALEDLPEGEALRR